MYDCPGCTYPLADNYDPAASVDDGSCIFSGCTDPSFDNYNPYANIDDGSCENCPAGNSSCPTDLDGNGTTNTADLLDFLTQFGVDCPE